MQTSVVVSWVLALVVMIGGPIALAIWFRRRYQVRWAVFFYGAAVFIVFQLLTRVPALTFLGPRIAPLVSASQLSMVLYLVANGLSAGLFESVGRWVGYRFAFPGRAPYDWANGVAFGIGHGGIESVLLVGLSSALSLVQSLALTAMTPEQMQASIPAASLAQAMAARSQLMALTWVEPMMAAWERLCTVPFHVAMSLVVLRVFTRRQSGWLWLAVALHGLLDSSLGLLARILGWPNWAIELSLLPWAVASIWFIVRSAPASRQQTQATPDQATS